MEVLKAAVQPLADKDKQKRIALCTDPKKLDK